jgi:hypothetical protein
MPFLFSEEKKITVQVILITALDPSMTSKRPEVRLQLPPRILQCIELMAAELIKIMQIEE